jgi:hypothetical protein
MVLAHLRVEIGLIPAALGIDRKAREWQPLNGLDREMNQIIFRYPIPQVRRQQHRSSTLDVFETMGHT